MSMARFKFDIPFDMMELVTSVANTANHANGNLTISSISKISSHDTSTGIYVAENKGNLEATFYELPLQELKLAAGDDWEEMQTDKALLNAFANSLLVIKKREQGIVPNHYTSFTYCKGCGYVYIPPDMVNKGFVLGCPWCSNRSKGLPIPRPASDLNRRRSKYEI